MQQHATTSDAKPDLDTDGVIRLWQGTTALWRAELGEPCLEAIVWQPFAHSHSIGAILLHLADVEGSWLEEGLKGVPRSEEERTLLRTSDNQPHLGRWAEPPEWPFEQYLEVLSWIRNRSLATLRQFDDPEHTFPGPKGPTTIADAVRYLGYHEAYHAGQAALHLIHFGWGGIEPG